MSGPESLLAEAFGLGRPVRPMVPGAASSLQTWRLDTTAGSFFVKRMWTDDAPAWRDALGAAMEFEERAAAAGVAMPRPVVPRTDGFGYALAVPGHGMFRVFEWVDARALTAQDDVADWLGETLALIHRLDPRPGAGAPDWYGLYPLSTWETLLDSGTAQGRAWGAAGRRALPAIEALSGRILRAFRSAGDPVRTHSDIEPWNVLMSARGPVLVDWETGGIDSATLHGTQAALACSFDDLPQAGRTLAAYRAAGGLLADVGDELLIRRAGLRLCRLYYRMQASLGSAPPGADDAQMVSRLDGLQEFGDELSGRARLLATFLR